MKKLFIRGKIFVGDDSNFGIPLCYKIGRAVFTHASDIVKAPFIMISRDAVPMSEFLQVAVGDAICALGGEVLLVDTLSAPAAALLTTKYKADFTVVIADGYVEILDSSGINISRQNELNIERIIRLGDYYSEESKAREGEIYCRRDAYLDYCNYIAEAAGKRKINTKIIINTTCGNTAKAAPQIFSRLTKNLHVENCTGDTVSLGEMVRRSGAEIGFCFDKSGYNMSVADARGELLSAESVYCLIAAKLAEKTILGNTLKEATGKGIKLWLLENGSIHFADILPCPDAVFTAVMLSIYLADKDMPLDKLVEDLETPQRQ